MTEQLGIFEQDLLPGERIVLKEVMGYTRQKPISVHLLTERTGMDVTAVRKALGSLGRKNLPIGTSRSRGSSGAWWASTPEDLEIAAKPIFSQGFKMLERARKLIGKKRMSEWMGQAQMELERKA